MSGFFKRNFLPVLAAAVLVGALVLLAVVAGGNGRELEAQRGEVFSLERELTRVSNEAVELEAEISEDVLGVDPARVEDDEQVLREMLNTALTWDSHESYEQARQKVMDDYGLGSDDSFVESFLPPAPSTTDSSGTVHSYIDASGLNSKLGSFETQVLDVKGTTYEYFLLVTVRSASADGQSMAAMTSPVYANVDADGNIVSLRGYAASTPVRSSS